MKKILITTALSTLLTMTQFSSAQAQPWGPGPDAWQDAPMSPAMMERMQQRRQMMMEGSVDDLPDRGDMHRRHHQQMQKMMGRRGQGKGGYGHCGGGKGKNPQMKQHKMQHMSTMEERLGNIESLLKELVELQKKQ